MSGPPDSWKRLDPASRSHATRPSEVGADGPGTSIREVLACIDGSELGDGVVPHAQAVACALGAGLTLLRVLETEAADAAPADPVEWGIRRQEARAQLDGLVERLGDDAPSTRSELIQGNAPEQICGWAERNAVDLTVVCSHGRRGLTEWDLASTARKLVERSPGSLLLVPAAVASGRAEVRYRRVLVPLDGSPRSESVVPVALRIAASHGGEVLLVHVVPAPEMTRCGPLDAEGAELEERVVEHNRRVAEDYLDRLRARLGPGDVPIRTRLVDHGSVRASLERVIREEEVDLVVMSAHGRTGRTDAPCGSIAEHVVTHATTPILLVRERGARRMRRVEPLAPRPLERLASPGATTL